MHPDLEQRLNSAVSLLTEHLDNIVILGDFTDPQDNTASLGVARGNLNACLGLCATVMAQGGFSDSDDCDDGGGESWKT